MTTKTEIDTSADVLDVRDIIARVEELREERDASELDPKEYGGPNDDWQDERTELAMLESFLSDIQGYGGDEQWQGDWYPVTLIADSYFTEYAQELLQDIGDLPKGIPHYIVIDWDSTAHNIRQDYTSAELDGTTYWMR